MKGTEDISNCKPGIGRWKDLAQTTTHKAMNVALLLGLSACVMQPMQLPTPLSEPHHSALHNVAPEQHIPTAAQTRVEKIAPLSALAANHYPAKAVQGLALPKGKFTINADGLPLKRFVHLAIGEVLKLSLEVDPAVAKRTDPVTLHITHPVSAARLLGMVEDALHLYDVALVRAKSGLRVLPITRLNTAPPAIGNDHTRTLIRLGRIMEFIPLNYALPGEVMSFARYFIQLGTSGDILINSRLNALLMIGDAASIARFRKAVAMVDRPALRGQQLRLIHPVYWQVDDLLTVVQKMLKATGVPLTNSGRSSGLRLIPVKQINALIAASPKSEWMDMLLTMLKRLDQPRAVGRGKRHFTYFVRNARAKELGAVLMQVLSGRSGSVGISSTLKPVRDATKVVGAKAKSASVKAVAAAASALPAKGSLAVITDERRNALVLVGTADAYRSVLPLLEQLDKPTRQVLIEATIAEVTLDNSTQFGVEMGFNNVDRSGKVTGVLSTIGGLGVGSAGLAYTLANAAGAVRLKLNALASEGKLRVLSSPRLLAMDNEPARIQIGDQVAVLSQEVGNATANGGNNTGLLRNFTYVDTGVILEVTPTINEGGMVQMKLHQEVSTPGASSNNTPPISKRSVDTTMLAKSGQTVLIGGLISHNKTMNRTKIPILGDIPILGYLFSNNTITDRATELIVLITPHIISGPDDAEYLTRAFQDQLGWGNSDNKDSGGKNDRAYNR